ncbi:RHS repeat-associated core domain-containing protein [Pseudomonas sp. RIT-PI-q]|uniref:RHS repeat-associated core domain-containing protein n=1 Tax=Pseudomonas sp. RIT-PI-q TaxID=1690247 RepID=UPI000750BF51|nr:RHS repeat-associated core domain-containing protein [Pseudomonas sp. RIT-PI-q]
MRAIILCRYAYDPLDRIVGTLPLSGAQSQYFYRANQFATETKGSLKRSIFQYDNQLLAEQQTGEESGNANLFATDQQQSVVHFLTSDFLRSIVYSPYGHGSNGSGLPSLLGFNGERRDPVTGCYLLGNGYRAFNPVLMRFNSPDSWSPFGRGGLNCYSYCSGNPISRKDPNGRYWASLIKVFQKPLKRLARGAQLPVFRANKLNNNPINPEPLKTPNLSKPVLFKNTREARFLTELKVFQEALKTDPFEVLKVTSAQDLKHLGGGMPRRFVLTEKGEMLIDPSIDLERRAINHAILASLGGSETGVISAGTISANPQRATIWNDSGHFKPDASALKPVAIFLNNLGVEVTSVRIR